MDESEGSEHRHGKGQVGSADVPESPKTTIRWDEGLKADVERCASERGVSVAEFMRQAAAHYVAWCTAWKRRDDEPDD